MSATALKMPEKATSEPAKAGEALRPFRIVLPKKGRLSSLFNALIAESGLDVTRNDARQDFGTLESKTTPLPVASEALYMRPLDGLRVLAAGAADMAVVGLDMLAEFNAAGGGLDDVTVTKLGMMPCGLYIAAPTEENYTRPQDLAGKRIATSFPALTQQWLQQNNVSNCTIIEYDGGIEDLVRLGVADVICDLVETGKTLAANGLRAQIKVMDSEIALVSRSASANAGQIADGLQNTLRRQQLVLA